MERIVQADLLDATSASSDMSLDIIDNRVLKLRENLGPRRGVFHPLYSESIL